MKKELERVFVIVKVLEMVGGAWFAATYALFLLNLGMDLFHINLVNTVFMAVSTVLDPLTGNWGDRIGQKKIYMLGIFFWAIGTGVYGFASNFWMCAIAESISAVGKAFRSEAMESWLKIMTDEETLKSAQSKSGVRARLALIPTAVLGGIVGAKWGLHIPWFLSGLTSMVILYITWRMLKKYPEKPADCAATEKELNLWNIACNSWGDIGLRKAFLLTGLLIACFQPLNMYWQIVMSTASGSSEWIGSVWIGVALMSAIGSRLIRRCKTNSKTIAMIIASIGLPLLLPVLPGNWILMILAPFLIHEIGRDMWSPLLWGYVSRRTNENVLTSVQSLKSSMGTLGGAIGLVVFGYLTRFLSPVQVWAVSATALIVVALWVWRWNHDD